MHYSQHQFCAIGAFVLNLGIGILINFVTKMNILLLNPQLRKAEKRWQ
jgi:hypothetical protein